MKISRPASRRLYAFAIIVGVWSLFVFLNNTNLWTAVPPGGLYFVAHRGVHQQFSRTNLNSESCTAARMIPSGHDFLENTVPSMRAAFAVGARIVEIDVHPTTDGRFVVFHDWTLDCRTNGSGVTRESKLTYLKSLDIAHGYTADGGASYPFRGRGIGMMPTLREVLLEFPDGRFAINIKSNDFAEGEALAATLAGLSPARRAQLIVYGADRPVRRLRERLPEMRVLTKGAMKDCLVRYIAYGWTGIVPDACRNTALLLPVNIAPYLWGWPHRFVLRMRAADAWVFAAGPYHGEGHSQGINSAEQLAMLPEDYAGGIWTDRIQTIAALAREGMGREVAR